MDKGDPSSNSGRFEVDPWSVEIAGECDRGGYLHNLEDILKPHDFGRKNLSSSLCGSVVNGDSLDRLSTGRPAEAV